MNSKDLHHLEVSFKGGRGLVNYTYKTRLGLTHCKLHNPVVAVQGSWPKHGWLPTKLSSPNMQQSAWRLFNLTHQRFAYTQGNGCPCIAYRAKPYIHYSLLLILLPQLPHGLNVPASLKQKA